MRLAELRAATGCNHVGNRSLANSIQKEYKNRMSVIDEICLVKGHNTISMIAADVIDPMFKLVVHKYELRCTQCGKTKEETDKYRISGRGKARQRKAKSNGNDNGTTAPSKAGASQAGHEAPQTEPLRGSEPAVLQPGVQPDSHEPANGN